MRKLIVVEMSYRKTKQDEVQNNVQNLFKSTFKPRIKNIPVNVDVMFKDTG